MSLQSALRTIKLMVQASSDKSIQVKNEYGGWENVQVRIGAIRALARPPFILTAPKDKKEWSPEEIEEFYQNNPKLKI